jgi:hypothetical protein
MSEVSYQSRQWLKLLWVFLPLFTLGMLLFDMRGQDLALLPRAITILMLINVVVLSMFGHLQIRLNRELLQWQFGFLGWPKWTLRIQDIRHVEVCETAWYEGRGIRFTREGMLYNADGRGAVRIIKTDGTRLRLGSAEPEVLSARIKEAMAQRIL